MIDAELLIKGGACKKVPAEKQIELFNESAERQMHILVSGKVNIYKPAPDGRLAFVSYVSPGEAFGGNEFFSAAKNDLVYIADADSVIFAITEKTFGQIAKSQPQVIFEVLKAAYIKPQKRHALLKKNTATSKAQAESEPQPAKTNEMIEANKTEEVLTQDPSVEILSDGIFPEGHKDYPNIVHADYAKLVYKKEYKCPFCGKKFEDFKVFQSKLFQAKPVRYDMRRYYSGFQTEWYDIVTCPVCYYSTFYNYYSEPKAFAKVKVEEALIAAQQSVKIDFEAERDINYVFTVHYLALVCSPGYMSSRRQSVARIWANLSWLYEDAEDDEMARFAAEKAAKAYEELYFEAPLSPIQSQVTCLTIAGMQYRAGIDNNMKKYLFSAKTNRSGNKVYSDLAGDLMEMLRTDKQEDDA